MDALVKQVGRSSGGLNEERKSGTDIKTDEAFDNAANGESPPKPVAGVGALLKNKPGNFFELLSQAVSTVKMDDGRNQDFQGYLQTSGIKMAWVRAIVALYEEPKKPDDPLAYILKLMGLGIPELTDVQMMQERIKYLRIKLLQLQSENEKLREMVRIEEEAQEQNVKTQELISLFDDSKYFSDYNSDDDQEYEAHPYIPVQRPSDSSGKKYFGQTFN